MIETIKTTVLELAKKQALDYLVLKIPFVGLPIIHPIVGFIVGKFISLLIEKTVLGAGFLAIDLSLEKDTDRLNKAIEKAKEAIINDDKEAIEKSSQEIVDASRKLIRFGRGL